MTVAAADSPFVPHRLLRNRHVQSTLASVLPRSWAIRLRSRSFVRASRECVLDCGDGVRLQGFHTPPRSGGSGRGLVVLLHGWEGSSASNHVLSAGAYLTRAGFAVFRLNFRDHGESHHLNREIFHSCRLAEVVGAVRAVSERFRARPLLIAGFSLGGNFALRVALRAPEAGIDLRHAVAVNPAIDPAHVLDALEAAPRIYEGYFIKKWRRSLLRKQAAFPGLYDFGEWMAIDNLREQTRYLIERHSEFAGLDEYLQGYSIAGSRLAGLRVPATLVASADDPIIPVADVRALAAPASLEVEVHALGGHCGFIDGLLSDSWIDRRLAAILVRAGRATGR